MILKWLSLPFTKQKLGRPMHKISNRPPKRTLKREPSALWVATDTGTAPRDRDGGLSPGLCLP